MDRWVLHQNMFSDGAGRSGVYIAIDANIGLCGEDGVFDVYGYLKKMRGLRRGLVETLVSYFVDPLIKEYKNSEANVFRHFLGIFSGTFCFYKKE